MDVPPARGCGCRAAAAGLLLSVPSAHSASDSSSEGVWGTEHVLGESCCQPLSWGEVDTQSSALRAGTTPPRSPLLPQGSAGRRQDPAGQGSWELEETGVCAHACMCM